MMIVLSSCYAMMGFSKVPFTTSSLNVNNGEPHSTMIVNAKVDDVTEKVINIAKSNYLKVIKKKCSNNSCELHFKSEAVDKQIVKGSGGGASYQGTGSYSSRVTTYSLNNYSKYFISIKQKDNDVFISAIGIPVLNNSVSCPESLASKISCTPSMLWAKDKDLVKSVQNDWSFDISGQTEAEAIEGIFAGL